jgi:hypothetical protein
MSADPVTVKRQHRRAREHLAESSTHGSATGSLIEVPRRGDVVEFKPERHRTTVAALEWGIKEAKRIRDWPALEKAVDLKIEELRKLVSWWGATVHLQSRPNIGSAAKRRFVPGADSCTVAPHSYSISSSASNWIELGTSMPSALAVCRLMANSNLVDRNTGRSAGFAPLRI